MTCKDTKDIDIVAFLHKNGIETTKKGSYFFCCSPYRDEKTASFSIDPQKNRWYDFGTGEKGDLLDLVKLMYKTDTTGALQILSKQVPDPSFSFFRAKSEPVESVSVIDLKHFQQIQTKALIDYLAIRNIPLHIARLYAQEVYYTSKKKKLFSIAFKNDKGGFDLRNIYGKVKTKPVYYTTIEVENSNELNIFEGFMDFLSALMHLSEELKHQVLHLKNTTIILNSLVNLPHVIPLLNNYQKINLFLDNDESGQKAAEEISKLHPCTVNQAAIIYPGHKDFNDFICGKNPNPC